MSLLLAERLGGRRFYLHETLGIIRTNHTPTYYSYSQKTKNSPNSLMRLGEFSLSLPSTQISETWSRLFENI